MKIPMSVDISPSSSRATVFVVDDDASVRASVQDLLESVGLHVYGFATTADFVLHLQTQPPVGPACLVLDIRMPGQSGLDFQKSMAQLGVHLPVIFVTGHGDVPMSVQAMKHGALEFLMKPFREQDLLDAIQKAINIDQAHRVQVSEHQALQSQWQQLTPGEQAVVRGVVAGQLNKQIAADLGVSEVTVKVRRGQAMRKLQLRSVADLVRWLDRLDAS